MLPFTSYSTYNAIIDLCQERFGGTPFAQMEDLRTTKLCLRIITTDNSYERFVTLSFDEFPSTRNWMQKLRLMGKNMLSRTNRKVVAVRASLFGMSKNVWFYGGFSATFGSCHWRLGTGERFSFLMDESVVQQSNFKGQVLDPDQLFSGIPYTSYIKFLLDYADGLFHYATAYLPQSIEYSQIKARLSMTIHANKYVVHRNTCQFTDACSILDNLAEFVFGDLADRVLDPDMDYARIELDLVFRSSQNSYFLLSYNEGFFADEKLTTHISPMFKAQGFLSYYKRLCDHDPAFLLVDDFLKY